MTRTTKKRLSWLLIVLMVLITSAFIFVPAILRPANRDILAEINGPIEQIPEQDRAWPLYRDVMVELAPLPDAIRGTDSLLLKGSEWDEAAQFVRDNQAKIDRLVVATMKPHLGSRFAVGGDALYYEMLGKKFSVASWRHQNDSPLSYLSTTPGSQFSSLLFADARVAMNLDDHDRLRRDILAAIRMADHVAEAPGVVWKLVASRMRLSATELILSRIDEITTPTLVIVAARFAQITPQDELIRAIKDDQLVTISVLQAISDWRGQVGGSQRSMRAHLRWLNRLSDAAIEEAQLPPWSTETPYHDLNREFESENARKPRYAAFAVRGPVWVSHSAAWNQQARLDTARVAIALELFRRDHGTYPQSLPELVPEFLETVPQDIFTGEPLRYVLAAGGPIVYSAGPDRDDDLARSSVGPDPVRVWLDPNRVKDADGNPRPDGDWILYSPGP